MKLSRTRNPRLLLLAVVLLAMGVLCLRGISGENRPHLTAWAALRGNSMLPTFPHKCLIELEIGVPFSDLKAGDIVVFYSGDLTEPIVCHRLVTKRGGGWVTKGDGNAKYDYGWVTASNYAARATGNYRNMIIEIDPPNEKP